MNSRVGSLSCYFSLVLVLTIGLLHPVTGLAGLKTVQLDGTDRLPGGGFDLEFQAAYESGRSELNTSYDALRAERLRIRAGLPFEAWGLLQASELWVRTGYSDMDPEFDDFESGFDGHGVGLSFQYNRFVAVDFEARLSPDNTLPEGGTDNQFRLGVPGQFPVGPGYLVGELGYTLRQGDRENGFDLGVGYVFEVSSEWSLGAEFTLSQPHIEGTDDDGNRRRQLFLTSAHQLPRGFRLIPYLGAGIGDGDPDWSLGLQLGWQYRPETRTERGSATAPTTKLRNQDQLRLTTDEDHREASREATRGLRAYERGQFSRAQRHFQRAWQLQPNDADHAYNYASVLLQRDRIDRVFLMLREARDRNPENLDLEFLWAYANYEDGKVDEARTQLEDILEENPDHAQAQKLQDRLNEDGS